MLPFGITRVKTFNLKCHQKMTMDVYQKKGQALSLITIILRVVSIIVELLIAMHEIHTYICICVFVGAIFGICNCNAFCTIIADLTSLQVLLCV